MNRLPPQRCISLRSPATQGSHPPPQGLRIVPPFREASGTSLAAEEAAGKDKRFLFHVPGLKLLSQTPTERTQESTIPLM